MKSEKWKDVPGYEGLYQVSDYGRVKSTKRQGASGGLAALVENEDGYLRVKLCKNGTERKVMVHRLVYETFVGKMPDGTEINHIDENKKNNMVPNLEAVSHIRNIRHGTGLMRCAIAHWKPIRQYTINGDFVAEYPSRAEAAKATGVNGSGISQTANGKQSNAGGFLWKYV